MDAKHDDHNRDSPTPSYEKHNSGQEKNVVPISIKVADPPFNNRYGDADLVLQSADAVKFFVHKVILRMSSEFFADMLSLPQPRPSTPQALSSGCLGEINALPVIPVSEDAWILHALLRMCYPPVVSKPTFLMIWQLSPILAAAQKYQFSEVTTTLADQLRAFSASQPLQTFAEAYHRGLDDVARVAAATFCRPSFLTFGAGYVSVPDMDTYVPEMDTVLASWYFRLLEYHNDVAQIARKNRRFREQLQVMSAPEHVTFCAPNKIGTQCALARTYDLVPRKVLAHPFADIGHADTVVCSSDGVEFHVNHAFLRWSSHTLTEMLSAASGGETPEPQDISVGNASHDTTLRLPEDGETLALLLQLCYPMPDPEITGGSHEDRLCVAYRLLEAASKYRVARALDFAKQMICTIGLVDRPLSVYFVASVYNWADVMKQAACRAIYEASDVYIPEMEIASSAAYRRLLVYRQKCRDLILARYPSRSPGLFSNSKAVVRAPYWSKSSWLSEPGDYELWLVMHLRMNEKIAAGRRILRLRRVSVQSDWIGLHEIGYSYQKAH
ncbi:uncharacterized protein C8Q71DRAFT_722967 [Rhodofomes roseus]|uniref:BTB domain-containing protein n=1 Tax=Rhodofomes roseus TaxID=34475 RepID=A0ABQ8KI43_9APHY|nr:uncharacterized protein C8Q71DRAFT_722967 [Rhodofomes roseus]KAH9837636.1 hypothetical protein C8Q71DRAFT_722967 [Rhodofomes roseus]